MKKLPLTLIVVAAFSGAIVSGCSGGDDSKSNTEGFKGPAPAAGVTPPGSKNPEQRAMEAAKQSGDTGADPGADGTK